MVDRIRPHQRNYFLRHRRVGGRRVGEQLRRDFCTVAPQLHWKLYVGRHADAGQCRGHARQPQGTDIRIIALLVLDHCAGPLHQ